MEQNYRCKQCGKPTDQLCSRSDCFNTPTNVALEHRRTAQVEQRVAEKQAVEEFGYNFNKVTAWAWEVKAIKLTDVPAIHKMAKETVNAAMCYAAIARSL